MASINCKNCKEAFNVTTKKFFGRRPERQGNKVIRCPNCGEKIIYNRIFKTVS